MTKQVADTVRLGSDIATGVTIAEVNDQNSLIVTAITILSRILIDFVIHRTRKRRKDGE